MCKHPNRIVSFFLPCTLSRLFAELWSSLAVSEPGHSFIFSKTDREKAETWAFCACTKNEHASALNMGEAHDRGNPDSLSVLTIYHIVSGEAQAKNCHNRLRRRLFCQCLLFYRYSCISFPRSSSTLITFFTRALAPSLAPVLSLRAL